jgi:exodeoxyribonuclease VII small subunit
MANNSNQSDFTASINQLEEINSWFQNEDLDLDEGLRKLRIGKELIKKCRARLQEVENEFIEIKKEFAQDPVLQATKNQNAGVDGDNIKPEDVPF